MTDNHPITPPPELVEQWYEDGPGDQRELVEYVATQAARWGADQELEACCQEVQDWYGNGSRLRDARRPKPPSLRQQACDALDTYVYGNPDQDDKVRTYNTIRRALEALPD